MKIEKAGLPRGSRVTRRRFLQLCAGAMVAAGAGTVGYAHTLGVSNLQVEQVTVRIPRLAPHRAGCRIVQLSDLHHGRADLALISRALGMALDLKPDFVVITGDFVDDHPADPEPLFRELKRITRHVETFGCTGNHDFTHDPTGAHLCAKLESAGVRMLRNAIHLAKTGPSVPGELCFVGVEDLWRGRFDPRVLMDAPTDAAVIFLCHNPDAFDDLDSRGRFDLMLSGHTHGGQVCLPGYGPLILPVKNKSRHTGLYFPDAAHPHRALHINRGIGHLMKVRLFCPPEVTCITLAGGA